MKATLLIYFVLASTTLLAQADEEINLDLADTVLFNSDSSYYQSGEEINSLAPDQLNATKEYRATSLELKKFDSAKWKEIVGDADFVEKKKEEEKIERKRSSVSVPWNSMWLKVIAYVAIIILCMVVIFYVIQGTKFSRTIRSVDRPSDPDLPVENIETLDMQRLVDDALHRGELPLVIRYYYLGLLKRLNSSGKIIWKKDKTNLDYLTELFAKGFYYKEVRTLTLAYEMIWYGERAIQRTDFDRLISEFQDIHQKVGEAPAV